MSVDIRWATITSGPDGQALEEKIRAFIHDKFQQVTLPRFIRSVTVHSFHLGDIPPEIEVKDICDPLPDFYEEDEDSDDDEGVLLKEVEPQLPSSLTHEALHQRRGQLPYLGGLNGAPSSSAVLQPHLRLQEQIARLDTNPWQGKKAFLTGSTAHEPLESPFPRSGTPGIRGGAGNLSYFNLPLHGLQGGHNPLAALAGGASTPWQHHADTASGHFPFGHPTSDSSARAPAQAPGQQTTAQAHKQLSSAALSIKSPSDLDPALYSPTQSPPFSPPQKVSDTISSHHDRHTSISSISADPLNGTSPPPESTAEYNPSPNDLQVTAHIKYSGNIRLELTASILLDYPMPSFVEIPLKLSITGLTFDGVALIAYINTTDPISRPDQDAPNQSTLPASPPPTSPSPSPSKHKVHFCFLSPSDASLILRDASVAESDRELVHTTDHHTDLPLASSSTAINTNAGGSSQGGLLQEIRVESEIGRKGDGGGQSLKNVGKVEKFVLEQVRRIFEDEFVFPSFWTFLV